jgi:hypothetical protein
MPHIAPIVAVVDQQGTIRCPEHNDELPMRPGELPRDPMYADNSAVDGETCFTCGQPIVYNPRLRVHVPY